MFAVPIFFGPKAEVKEVEGGTPESIHILGNGESNQFEELGEKFPPKTFHVRRYLHNTALVKSLHLQVPPQKVFRPSKPPTPSPTFETKVHLEAGMCRNWRGTNQICPFFSSEDLERKERR